MKMLLAVDPDKILHRKRQCFDKFLVGSGYWIQFTTPLLSIDGGKPIKYTFCYPHDEYLAWIMIGNLRKPGGKAPIKDTESWDLDGKYSMPTPSIIQMKHLIQNYQVA